MKNTAIKVGELEIVGFASNQHRFPIKQNSRGEYQVSGLSGWKGHVAEFLLGVTDETTAVDSTGAVHALVVDLVVDGIAFKGLNTTLYWDLVKASDPTVSRLLAGYADHEAFRHTRKMVKIPPCKIGKV